MGFYDMELLRHFLAERYGWSYGEVNEMTVEEAQIALLLGRKKKS